MQETIPSYTEQVDLADMAEGPLREQRDERWASFNEQRLVDRTKDFGLFAPGSTKATCGTTKCFLVTSSVGAQSSYNTEQALDLLSSIGVNIDGSRPLTSNKVYSIRKKDGSTEFMVELLKAS